MSSSDVIGRMDEAVDHFARRIRIFNEDLTPERAKMFVLQHRQNTRFRNSVCKLRVATNCPDWEVKLEIVGAVSDEIISDVEFGDGRPHWKVLEDLGVDIGLAREDIEAGTLLQSTQLCWLAWETLCGNRHWLEGLVANTCAERFNIPGYGEGKFREGGWFGVERPRWETMFGLNDKQLLFFHMHSLADVKHSDLGWNTVAKYATDLGMEDAAVEACRVNLSVWEHYLNGIVEAADDGALAGLTTSATKAA